MRLMVKLKPEPLLNLKLVINRPEHGMRQNDFTDPEKMNQASVLKWIVHPKTNILSAFSHPRVVPGGLTKNLFCD